MKRLLNWIKELFGINEEEIKEKKIAVVEYGEDSKIEEYINRQVGDNQAHWYYYDEVLGIDGLMIEIEDLHKFYDVIIVYPARPNLVDWGILKKWNNVKLFPFL